MRVVVLGSATSWYVADLIRAAGARHEIHLAPFSQIAAVVEAGGLRVSAGSVDLAAGDAVLVRSMPPGSLEQIVFRMDTLGRLAAAGVPVVNPPRTLETAIDKFLSTARLQEADLATPRTAVCQTADHALEQFDAMGGEVVVKPLFGGEGRGITKVDDRAVAWRVFKTLEQLRAVFYLQEFVPHHGYDLRLLVLGDDVLGMRRRNDDDWRTNIALGGRAEPLDVDADLAEVARRAAAAVGATIAGVDLLPARDGRLVVLEVNAVPGWRALAEVAQVDVAALVLQHLEQSTRRSATRVGQGDTHSAWPATLDATPAETS